MVDDSGPRREALNEFLQEQGPPTDDDEHPQGAAVLVGWVVVTDWMDETGERWITRGFSASKVKWDADGMLHEALYGNWVRDGS